MTERENCDKMLMTKRRKEKMKNYSKARKAGIIVPENSEVTVDGNKLGSEYVTETKEWQITVPY